ncbi:hypothetical protein G7Z17_g1206 [Cylindrodendrum hubeiense]|uniref:Uncharacterized protein n=1 Tax=Cylindrodendrum hubeiense TaxID=595255 RepID=A0A9P5LKA0_9HYPO|nr:hypothetical protein G7Z17_g1206 [Cylindrodendrum hubeiense]
MTGETSSTEPISTVTAPSGQTSNAETDTFGSDSLFTMPTGIVSGPSQTSQTSQTTGDKGPTSTGPSISISTGGVLITSTMTEPLAGWSPTTVSSHPEWTTNTWITTTSDGSSEPTIVPVLVGCAKCGGSGSGIVIFGWPKITGTLFSFPGFPKFSFPCIPPGCITPPNTPDSEKGDDDGDNNNSSNTEDDQSSTEESTTSTCTEEVTASDCLVACTTYTGETDPSANECTTWCTQTHKGCSATGITSTTEVEACSATGDGSCQSCGDGFAPDDQDNADDDDSELLEKRWSPTAEKEKNVGGCIIPSIQFPEYPSGNDIFKWEAQIAAASPASPLDKIARWYWSERLNCVYTLKGPTTQAIYHQGQSATGMRLPTIDHIYEKSFLKDYFRSVIDLSSGANAVRGTTGTTPATKINCDDLDFYSSDGTGPVWLQKVYSTFPGAQKNIVDRVQPTDPQFMDDLMGVDKFTNGECKGPATNPDKVRVQTTSHNRQGIVVTRKQSWTVIQKWIKGKLEFLEKLALAVDLMDTPTAKDAMKRQNQRVWSRLQDMDENARNCKLDSAVLDGIWSFADRYQDYMTYRFDGGKSWSINDAIDDAQDKILPRIDADIITARRHPNKVNKDVNDWRRRYNVLKARSKWAVSIDWEWTHVVKRQDDTSEGGACTLPTKTQTASTVSSQHRAADINANTRFDVNAATHTNGYLPYEW